MASAAFDRLSLAMDQMQELNMQNAELPSTENKTNPPVKVYYNWLSSFRGICAILVVLRHLLPYIHSCATGRTFGVLFDILTNAVDCGKVGVVGFFLISGFLVPAHLQRKARKEFVLDRVIRLYPTYWVSILLAVTVLGGFSLKQVIVNASMFQLCFRVDDVIGVYWTLPIEVLFYVGCLILYKWIKEGIIKWIDFSYYAIGAVTIAVSVCRRLSGEKLPVAIPLLICVSILGYYIRMFEDEKINIRMLLFRIACFAFILVPTCIIAYDFDMGFNERWYVYLLSYIVGILMFIAFRFGKFEGKILMWFGGISYSMYLTHRVFISKFLDEGNEVSILRIVGVICIIIISAYLINFLIEKKLGNFLKEIVVKLYV